MSSESRLASAPVRWRADQFVALTAIPQKQSKKERWYLIQFSRSFARELRSVFGRCARKVDKSKLHVIEFHTDSNGLRARMVLDEVCIERLVPGSHPAETLHLPLTALNDLQGSGEESIALAASGPNKCLAEWLQRAVPRAVEYDVPNVTAEVVFPGLPDRFVENPSRLLESFQAASEVAATEGIRYAVHRLLLRGQTGEIIATDGRQLLVQGGSQFPWEENLLVTNLPVFGSREVKVDGVVSIGKTEHHVVLRAGEWTFWLLIDATARYPEYERVIPRQSMDESVGCLDSQDREFLVRSLPDLPGSMVENHPVTVDLNGSFSVRADDEDQRRPTELVLARSMCTGRPRRFRVNRQFLSRLAKLGFSAIHVADAEKPFTCRDENRLYLCMPLGKAKALSPDVEVLRVSSMNRALSPLLQKRRKPLDNPTTNGSPDADSTGPNRTPARSKNGTGKADLIAEAEALCTGLRETATHANRLLGALRRRRKQSKLVATTLASLRNLQNIDA